MANSTMLAPKRHGLSPGEEFALYKEVVENLKEVVFQTDLQGNWTFLNRAWSEMTGHDACASVGQPFLAHVHPEDRERAEEAFRPLAEGGAES
ncbi:MAG TPA: PAS domain-containing protein, partial [Candidatus Thermoplasmatota archaeon]|nr:PAS domain-containing protein [Candidatus Thermoplasmatota archaeon]